MLAGAGAADAEELAADPGLGGHRRRDRLARADTGPGPSAPAAGDLVEPAEGPALDRGRDGDADHLGRLQGQDHPAEDARVADRGARGVAPGQAVAGAGPGPGSRRPARPGLRSRSSPVRA